MPVLRPINLKKPIVNRKLIAWVFVLTGIVSIGFWWSGRNREVQSSWDIWGWFRPLKITYTVEKKTLVQAKPKPDQLITNLNTRLVGEQGTYGIQVYRLNTSDSYGINENQIFPAASIMKVPIMAATYRKIEDGSLKLEDVRDFLEAMGKRSDNQASTILISKIGRPYLRQILKDLGMTHSNFDDNTTTPADLSQMWLSLQQGKVINAQNWQQMQGFLSDSIYEERISAGVGSGVRVVHKVGSDVTIWADTGIIYTKLPYILSILNVEVTLGQAKVTVPELVKMIHEFESANQ